MLEALSDKQLRNALTAELSPEYRDEACIDTLTVGGQVKLRNDLPNAPKIERRWKAGKVVKKEPRLQWSATVGSTKYTMAT